MPGNWFADKLCDMKLPHDEHMTAFYTSDPMLQSGAMCSYYSLKATCARQHLLMLFFWISFFFLPDSSVCVNLGLFLFLTFRSVPLFNKACDILPSVALQQQRGVNLSLQSRRSRQYVGGISSCLYLGPAGFQNCRGFFFFSLLNELTELG